MTVVMCRMCEVVCFSEDDGRRRTDERRAAGTAGNLGDAGKRPRGTAETSTTVGRVYYWKAEIYFVIMNCTSSNLYLDRVHLRPTGKPAVVALGRGCPDGV